VYYRALQEYSRNLHRHGYTYSGKATWCSPTQVLILMKELEGLEQVINIRSGVTSPPSKRHRAIRYLSRHDSRASRARRNHFDRRPADKERGFNTFRLCLWRRAASLVAQEIVRPIEERCARHIRAQPLSSATSAQGATSSEEAKSI
jgi:hypothetical protein